MCDFRIYGDSYRIYSDGVKGIESEVLYEVWLPIKSWVDFVDEVKRPTDYAMGLFFMSTCVDNNVR